jgi:hypothetical protein
MKPANSEFIWGGKIHLGDEPGVYGDAQYSGLCVEYPITVDTLTAPQSGQVTITITASSVKIYTGYLGHKITIYKLEPLNPALPLSKWQKVAIAGASARITVDGDTDVTFNFSTLGTRKTNYISVAIEIDSEVAPGLYDDFQINEISFASVGYAFFASFGFKYSN